MKQEPFNQALFIGGILAVILLAVILSTGV
jgi:hypothetical protein